MSKFEVQSTISLVSRPRKRVRIRKKVPKPDGPVHRCRLCKRILKTEDELKLHTSIMHPDMRYIKYDCIHCKTPFSSAAKLTRHMREHLLECNFCSYKVREKKKLHAHLATEHFNIKVCNKVCNLCGKMVSSKSMSKHMLWHTLSSEAYKCPYCKHQADPLKLHRHIKEKHKDKSIRWQDMYDLIGLKRPDCTCPICKDNSFKSMQQLTAHITRTHPLQCAHCEFNGFGNSKGRLLRHLLGIHFKYLRPQVKRKVKRK